MARRRNARGHGDRLREELLDAAEELLAEAGDEREVTVRAVVEKVGVTPPSLYLHFDDKAALIREVVARRFGALAAATSTAASQHPDDPAAALRAGVRAYLGWARDNPGGYAVLFSTHRETQLLRPDGTGGSDAFDNLVERVRRCQEAGVAGDGDPHLLATLIWSAEHGIATLSVARPHFPWPDVDHLIDELLQRVVGLPGRVSG